MKTVALALFAVLLFPALVLALGADHPKGPVQQQDWWPAGMQNLVNDPARVHGYWVNSEEIFYFAGGTKSLNDFLDRYAKLAGTKLVVVLHPGPKEARSPWDKGGAAPGADWRLYFAPRDWVIHNPTGGVKATDPKTISRVDVWLGSGVRLDELQVPPNVTVESGGEIEEFVRKRKG